MNKTAEFMMLCDELGKIDPRGFKEIKLMVSFMYWRDHHCRFGATRLDIIIGALLWCRHKLFKLFA